MEKKKILVIEDETVMRESLEDVLANNDYEVKTACDGEEGIELIKSFSPDLILLDIILPKKDGFEVLQSLKSADEENKINIPVILLTNISGMESVQKALDLGATTYLVKADYQLNEILEKIKETLE